MLNKKSKIMGKIGFDEHTFEREDFYEIVKVDGSFVNNLSKIYVQTIIDNLAYRLWEINYKIIDVDIYNLKFVSPAPSEFDIHYQRPNGEFSAFVLKLEKAGYSFDGVYQLFKNQIGIFRDGNIRFIGCPYKEKVLFDIQYSYDYCIYDEYDNVVRASRCYKVKKRWFKHELMLEACEDRMVYRRVLEKRDNAKKDFNEGIISSEKMTKYRKMTFYIG